MPIFKVWFPDNGQSKDDATTVKAFDHEDAAAKWADWYRRPPNSSSGQV